MVKDISSFSDEGKEAFETFSNGIESYKNITTKNTNIFKSKENIKDTINYIMIGFFSILIILFFIFFWKKIRGPIDFISNIVFVTIPLVLVITGILIIGFMIAFDFCNSIHASIYENDFPIYGKGLGKLFNCFDSVIIIFI